MKITPTQSGFSLVETLVAITILMLVIIGPLSITSSAARSTSFASEQVIASLLAQEGAELAQKGRDDMILESFAGSRTNAWTDFTNPNGVYRQCYSTRGCGLTSALSGELLITNQNCGGAGDTTCLLRLDPATAERAVYNHATGVFTPFRREILFVRNGGQIQVRSVVKWRSGNIKEDQQVSVETYLLNIYDK